MSQRRTCSPYEIAFRNACSEITILDHGQNDLLQRLSHVRAWRQQKLAQLTHLVHANTPISRLPNETFASIFEIVHRDAIAVSHVSRQWRHLALRLPSLWRNIRLGMSIDQITEYLNRSQSLSLAITFDVVDNDLRDEHSDDEDGRDVDYDSHDEYVDDGDPQETSVAFMARLTLLIHHVSRWHSLHVNCPSSKTMFTVLEYLGDLSAPCLTYVSVQLSNGDFDNSPPEWDVAIFSRSAPQLRTVHLRGIALSNCLFPPAALVELEVDARDISFGFMNPKVFTHMPNLRVADIRGAFISLDGDKDPPLTHPTLERLTWGCLSIQTLFSHLLTPALRYLHLTSPHGADIGYDGDLQDFPDAITNCPHLPILPILDELHYDINTNYAADCIFVGLPRVSLVRFPLHVNESDWELCRSFFKALIDDSSRWPHLTTIVFEGLPDQLFNSLRDFVLARSSLEHRFTIRLEGKRSFCPYTVRYRSNEVKVEDMAWLRQHVNVEMVSRKHK